MFSTYWTQSVRFMFVPTLLSTPSPSPCMFLLCWFATRTAYFVCRGFLFFGLHIYFKLSGKNACQPESLLSYIYRHTLIVVVVQCVGCCWCWCEGREFKFQLVTCLLVTCFMLTTEETDRGRCGRVETLVATQIFLLVLHVRVTCAYTHERTINDSPTPTNSCAAPPLRL